MNGFGKKGQWLNGLVLQGMTVIVERDDGKLEKKRKMKIKLHRLRENQKNTLEFARNHSEWHHIIPITDESTKVLKSSFH